MSVTNGGANTMWTCSMLKNNARDALRGRYWRSFWGCFLIALVSDGGITNLTLLYSPEEITNYLEALPTYLLAWVLLASLIGTIIGILWNIFISAPLEVGRCRYFMEGRQSPSPITTFFGAFQTPYLNVVKVSFLTALKIYVGLILFLIPGIYWSYCYALVPFLLAENPYLTTSRAMELSKEMMYGEKLHYFLLELLRMSRTDLVVYIHSIRFTADDDDFGAQLSIYSRSSPVRRSIGTVQHHFHTVQAQIHSREKKTAVKILCVFFPIQASAQLFSGHVTVGIDIANDDIFYLFLQRVIQFESFTVKEFDPIVFKGIVGCGNDNSCIGFVIPDQICHSRGRNYSGFDHISPYGKNSCRQGVFQHVARYPRILSDHKDRPLILLSQDIGTCLTQMKSQFRSQLGIGNPSDTVSTK